MHRLSDIKPRRSTLRGRQGTMCVSGWMCGSMFNYTDILENHWFSTDLVTTVKKEVNRADEMAQ